MGDFADRLADATDQEVKGGDEMEQALGWLDTGNYALNWAVSGRFQRGWPLGHVVEVFGESGTGKSYLAQRAVKGTQDVGGWAHYDDTEARLNPDFAEKLGIDLEDMSKSTSHTVEDHFDVMKAYMNLAQQMYDDGENEGPFLLVLDSLAEMTTEAELDAEMDTRVQDKPLKIHSLLRQVSTGFSEIPALYFICNRVYDDPGASPWESARNTPGGKGTNYRSTVRLDLRTPKWLKEDGDRTAVRIRAVVDKNTVTSPWKEASMVIPFNRPISPYSGLITKLLELNIIETSGHTVVHKGEDTGIKAQKSNLLKQEKSSRQLVDEYPDIIEYADQVLEERENG